MPKYLTEKQKVFADRFAKTDDAAYAAWCAGIASPEKNGTRMLKVPMVAEAIEAKRMSDCILLESLPEISSIFVARLKGAKDYAGREHAVPTHEQFAKLAAPYLKFVDSAVTGITTTSKDAGEIDGAGLVARLRAVVEQGEAELQRIEAVAAARAKPVAPTEIDETDVFG